MHRHTPPHHMIFTQEISEDGHRTCMMRCVLDLPAPAAGEQDFGRRSSRLPSRPKDVVKWEQIERSTNCADSVTNVADSGIFVAVSAICALLSATPLVSDKSRCPGGETVRSKRRGEPEE